MDKPRGVHVQLLKAQPLFHSHLRWRGFHGLGLLHLPKGRGQEPLHTKERERVYQRQHQHAAALYLHRRGYRDGNLAPLQGQHLQDYRALGHLRPGNGFRRQ